MKLDHAKSMALIILLTITATSSATWYLTAHSLSAPQLPSYDYPGSGSNSFAYLIYQDTGGIWLRVRGDTRLQDDWSVADSPTTDPSSMINRTLTVLGRAENLVVKGDFTTAKTITILNTGIGGLFIYGTVTETANRAAILVDDEQGNGFSIYGKTGPTIYIRDMVGPAGQTGVYTGFTSSAGIRMQNSLQVNYDVGTISGFQYGILVDQTVLDGVVGRTIVNDNRIHVITLIFNAYEVRFLGPRAGAPNNVITGCQGNHWTLDLVYSGAVAGTIGGIVKDAGLLHQYNEWFGLSFVVAGSVPDFQNNAGDTTNGLTGTGGDFINAIYGKNFLVQPGDTLIVDNPQSDQGGVYGNSHTIPRLQISQSQLGVSFTAATSKAVTFPLPEVNATYSLSVTFHQNLGNYWITSLTTAGCTINWSTSSTGTLDYFVYR